MAHLINRKLYLLEEAHLLTNPKYDKDDYVFENQLNSP